MGKQPPMRAAAAIFKGRKSHALLRSASSCGTFLVKTKDFEPCGEYRIADREHGPGSPRQGRLH